MNVMDSLIIKIFPSQIPLGIAVDASIMISCPTGEALVDLWGRLSCTSGIHIIGDESIHVPKLTAGQEAVIPIRIKGIAPRKAQITFSKLNAYTAGGRYCDFKESELSVVVAAAPQIEPHEISFTLESKNSIIQNVITRLECRLHNNSNFPLVLTSYGIKANGSEVHRNSGPPAPREIQPGTGLSIDVHVIPKLAGDIALELDACFKIMEIAFGHKAKLAINVFPSSQVVQQGGKKNAQTILVITSSPIDKNLGHIRTDIELKKILVEMKQSARLRDQFQIEILPAATSADLTREIIVQRPFLVHFAGHGTEEGILVEDEFGNKELFPTHALANLLQPLSNQLECVILNACNSAIPAEEIAKSIRFVIGMQKSISDDSALEFTTRFYQALGAGHSIEESFQIGKAGLANKFFNEKEIPYLVTRPA